MRASVVLAALLLVGCRPRDAKPQSALSPVPVVQNASIEQTVRILSSDIGPREPKQTYPELERTRRYITDRLRASGYEVELQEFKGRLKKPVFNLIATLKGNDEIVVVGAHYDSVDTTPGADDNGSGVAVLLQLAERLAGTHPERTIRFVFFANEEPPYFMTSDMGSHVYARSCAQRKDKIVGMLSLETMGYYSDEPNSQHFPPGIDGYPTTGNFVALVTEEKSKALLQECLESFEGYPVESLMAPGSVEGVSFSDHASFWEFGYPALMVTDTAFFRNPNYHRQTDTADTLNFPALDKVANGLEKVVRALEGQPKTPST